MNFHSYILIPKKEILGSDIKTYINNEDFKINDANKPRVFANTLKKLVKQKVYSIKVFLHYVITEKMISALHGQFRLKK